MTVVSVVRGGALRIGRRIGAVLALAAAATLAIAAPPLAILAPAGDALRTERDFVNVLARTDPAARATIGGSGVPVYTTGVFVRDRVPLAPGLNRIRVEVVGSDGEAAASELLVERVLPTPPPAPPTDRAWIDPASLRPAEDRAGAEGEAIEVAFDGTPGLAAAARLHAGDPWQPLAEAAGRPGRYVGRLVLRGGADRDFAPLQVRLQLPRHLRRWPDGSPLRRGAPREAIATARGRIALWRSESQRLHRVSADSAELTWGLHEVRLGGPFVAELPRGTLLAVTGRHGERLRVALAPDVPAWVAAAALEPAPPGTVLPRPVLTSLAVAASADGSGDTLTLGWPANLPLAVEPAMAGDGRPALDVELFGTHLATTWITHRASRRLVREVSAAAAGRDRVRVRVLLESAPLWGWRVERDAAATRIVIVAPPRIDAAAASPLAGLGVALEAGHGGPGNLGAVGATGVPEKDINRWTAEALQQELEAAGARVAVIRAGDEAPTLRERAQRVLASGAQLFVSLHANSSDTGLGYLRAAGTSTYYKHAPSRDLAAALQRRLLEATALPDFGLVGNFNYAPIRLVTAMPAVLVEQAFVSNPQEEARLLDPAFRALLARAVRQGLEDHLRSLPR